MQSSRTQQQTPEIVQINFRANGIALACPVTRRRTGLAQVSEPQLKQIRLHVHECDICVLAGACTCCTVLRHAFITECPLTSSVIAQSSVTEHVSTATAVCVAQCLSCQGDDDCVSDPSAKPVCQCALQRWACVWFAFKNQVVQKTALKCPGVSESNSGHRLHELAGTLARSRRAKTQTQDGVRKNVNFVDDWVRHTVTRIPRDACHASRSVQRQDREPEFVVLKSTAKALSARPRQTAVHSKNNIFSWSVPLLVPHPTAATR